MKMKTQIDSQKSIESTTQKSQYTSPKAAYIPIKHEERLYSSSGPMGITCNNTCGHGTSDEG